MDFSLKEPKERTLEERQREIRSDFQAGRSVVVDIVAVLRGWCVCRWLVYLAVRGVLGRVVGIAEYNSAAIACQDKFCGLTFSGVSLM